MLATAFGSGVPTSIHRSRTGSSEHREPGPWVAPTMSGPRRRTDVRQRDAVRVLVIDAANVIGSRPTGWWRDRPRAARDFVEGVRATVVAGRLRSPVTVVLEGRSRAGAHEAEVD